MHTIEVGKDDFALSKDGGEKLYNNVKNILDTTQDTVCLVFSQNLRLGVCFLQYSVGRLVGQKVIPDRVNIKATGHHLVLINKIIANAQIHYKQPNPTTIVAFEKGPWRVVDYNGSIRLQSDDFTHDANLEISGDFSDREEKLMYAEEIVKRLNAYRPE